MRESPIESYLVKQAKANGGEVRKVRWIGRRGAPDRVLMFPRVLVWVELKATGEPLEPHQEREHARMKRMGQNVVKVDSFEEVDMVVRGALQASRLLQLLVDGVEGNA